MSSLKKMDLDTYQIRDWEHTVGLKKVSEEDVTLMVGKHADELKN